MAPPIIYVSYSYFTRVLGDTGRANRVWITTDRREPTNQVAQTLEARFQQAGMNVERILTSGDERESIDFHFTIVVVFLLIMAVVLALVGGLALMGTMSINVVERRREIGIMRAIGAADGAVRQVFVVEGMFVGALSWLPSLVAAFPISKIVLAAVAKEFLRMPPPDYVFSVGGALLWLVIVILFAAASCYLPAQNAVQTSVRELLAYE
jgi:putative ABC transport system permease protein